MKRTGKAKNIADKVLHSMLDNEDIASKVRGISATTLLQKLDSKNISEGKKRILLVLFDRIIDKMKLPDIVTLFEKLLSQQAGATGGADSDLVNQGKSVAEKLNISEKDLRIVTKIIEGVPLRAFPGQMELSSSTVNKRIMRLCERLGLRNREQLIYVLAYLHLISLDLKCLRTEE